MGLDQYAYKVKRVEENTDFYYPETAVESRFADWRKHPNLEGWMANLYNRKADAQGFVGKQEYPMEVSATVVGSIDASEVTEELLSQASTDETIKQTVLSQAFAAMAANISQTRTFNCQPLRLTTSDLDQLEMHVRLGTLPATVGFFFGDNSDDHYRGNDLKFIEDARKAIEEGFDVYYQSWW